MQLWIGLLLLALGSQAALADGPRKILILNPFGRDTEPFASATSAFRTTLARELGEAVNFYEVPLDLARFKGQEGEGPWVSFLEERIRDAEIDLVVPIGGASVQFAARHRERLFPDAPVLVVGAAPRMIPDGFLSSNATLVTSKIDLQGMIEDILGMQPETERIAMVFGSSPLRNTGSRNSAASSKPLTNASSSSGSTTFRWKTCCGVARICLPARSSSMVFT